MMEELMEDEDSVEGQPEAYNDPEASYHHVLSAQKVDEDEEKKRLEEAVEQGRQQV